MRLTNKNGTIITDKNSWKLSFIEVDNEKHWEEGRSAYELAKHFSEPSINDSKGFKKINECLRLIGFNDIVFTHGQIEHESRFDKFRGKGRMQDLVLWGNTNEKRIVVCIEAKVDETFGKEIKDAYAAAKKKGGNSNASKRIEKLIENFHLWKDSDKIRYQLLHYLAGSISEAKQYGDIVFMPIIVYHTSKFNAKKGKKNKEDYEHFHKSLNFLKVPNTNIYEKEFDGTQVYITYIEIDSQKEY